MYKNTPSPNRKHYPLKTFLRIIAVPSTAETCIYPIISGMSKICKLRCKFFDTTPSAPMTRGLIVVDTLCIFRVKKSIRT